MVGCEPFMSWPCLCLGVACQQTARSTLNQSGLHTHALLLASLTPMAGMQLADADVIAPLCMNYPCSCLHWQQNPITGS